MPDIEKTPEDRIIHCIHCGHRANDLEMQRFWIDLAKSIALDYDLDYNVLVQRVTH